MALSAAVFAADEATVTELAAALGAAGYTIAARAIMSDEPTIAKQLAAWIEGSSITVAVGTSTDASRAALVPLITRRLLGFSDLRDIDGGRCGTLIAVLVPPEPDALASAVTKVLPRIESELVGKPASRPPKVSIPARPTGSASSSTHLPPLAQRLPVAAIAPPRKEDSVIAKIPPAPPSRRTPAPRPPVVPARRAGRTTPPPLPVSVSGGRAMRTEEMDPLSLEPEQGAPLTARQASKGSTRTPATPPPPPPSALRVSTKAPPAAATIDATGEQSSNETTLPLEYGTPTPVLTSLMSALVTPPAADTATDTVTASELPSTTQTEAPLAAAAPPADGSADVSAASQASGAPVSAVSEAVPDASGPAAPAASSLSSFDATAGLAPKRSRRGLVIGLAVGGAALGAVAFLLLGGSSSTSASPSSEVATRTPAGQPAADESARTPETPPVDPSVVDDSGAAAGSDEAPTIEIEEPSAAAPAAERPSAPSTGAARPAPTSKPAPSKPATRATIVAPVSADGCDKVSCVIDAYARPCCEKYRPKKPGDTPAELDRAMITTGMRTAKAAVIRCGEQHASAKGIVRLAMKVRPDGSVEEAAVSEAPDPALGECVSSAAKKVTFAKTESGGSFAYPFKF